MTMPLPQQMLAGRFELLGEHATGGMATIHRALDRVTGRQVAVKIMDPSSDPAGIERFMREAELLESLRHPRIVEYIAHSTAEDGRPFFAMEWLEGEDLSTRLEGEPLTMHESLEVVLHAAEGLTVAHARGIVHRDIKPSNLFLRGRSVDGLVVLDFGIARRLGRAPAMQTRTGVLIGTPHYMAPEQARGKRDLTPSVDVFALGCVLFQLLTGELPFTADNLVGVLAKIVLDDAPRVRSLRPAVPHAVELLVDEMLAKDPTRRPLDASDLLAKIAPLLELPEPSFSSKPIAPAGPTSPSFSGSEQAVVSVVLAVDPAHLVRDHELSEEESDQHRRSVDELRASLMTFGAEVEGLANGAVVSTVAPTAGRVASDQAAQAARLAMSLRDHWPAASIAVTTGRGIVKQRLPIGDAIDRAISLLREHAGAVSPEEGDGIVLDETTSHFLDESFDQATMTTGASVLRGERAHVDALRRLLGKPTPCVGREQEIGTLESLLAGCIDDGRARGALIIASPGMGKSRVRHELIRRVEARGTDTRIVIGRADFSAMGNSYGVLRSALLVWCDASESEPVSALRAKLTAAIASVVPASDAERITLFISEMTGLADENLGPLRSDARALGEDIARAFVELLSSICKQSPLLLVLEDLHWADTMSVTLIERALHELEELPLLVLGFARPEIDEKVSKTVQTLWQRIPLRGLARRAAERLVIEILGRDVPREVVERVVEQAAGNALFLEELIRSVADGKGDRECETVLAMLQSRLSQSSAEQRRVLRACSVFGVTCWRGGVLAVLGDTSSEALDARFEELVKAEMLERHATSLVPGDTEYGFRHSLLREAAYGLLTPEDRRTGHMGAGRYLEQAGKVGPSVLARHYRAGGEPMLAFPHYVRAGREAARVGGLPEARRHFAAAYSALEERTLDPALARQRVDVLLQQVELGMMSDTPDTNLKRVASARALLDANQVEPVSDEDVRRDATIDYLQGRIEHYLGRTAEPLVYCRRALPKAEQLGDAKLAAMTSQTIGVVYFMQGRATAARPLLERALALVDTIDAGYERLRVRGNHAMCLVMAGEARAGLDAHADIVARARDDKHPSGLSVALAMQSFSYRLAGDIPNLLEASRRGVLETERSNERLLHYITLSLHGWALALGGSVAEARAYRERAEAFSAERLGARVFYADWFLAADAQIALRGGNYDDVIAITTSNAPRLAEEERYLGLGLLEQACGFALLAKNEVEAGNARLAHALSIMEQSGQRMAAAQLRLEWGEHGNGDARDAALATYAAAKIPEVGLAYADSTRKRSP